MPEESPVELAITEISGVKIIKIVGKVDWECARLLDKEIQQVIDNGFYQIAFNLNDVSFICSGGIGALVYNLNKVKKLGGAIYIISSNEYVNYLFRTLKFDVVFDNFLFASFEDFSKAIIEKKEAASTGKK
jgi:anti-anti-sigma factor